MEKHNVFTHFTQTQCELFYFTNSVSYLLVYAFYAVNAFKPNHKPNIYFFTKFHVWNSSAFCSLNSFTNFKQFCLGLGGSKMSLSKQGLRKARSRGLVVKGEGSWLRGCGFKPLRRRPFFTHHSFGSKYGSKNWVEINLALLHLL